MKDELKNPNSDDRGLLQSGKFWALVAVSFVLFRALPKRRKSVSVASNIVPRAVNQTGHLEHGRSEKV